MSSDLEKRLEELAKANETLRAELDNMRNRVDLIEHDNQDLLDRCSDAESAHFRFVNLYVASQRLSSTLDLEEILEAIQEIVVNLVGSEQFGLFFISEESEETPLVLATEVVVGESNIPRPPTSHPRIQAALRDGSLYVAEHCDSNPVAVIPLRMESTVLGVIVLYGVLPQKSRFNETDIALFDLLANSAGKAFYAAVMHIAGGTSPDLASFLRDHFCPGSAGRE